MMPQEQLRVLLAMALCGVALAVVYDALWLLRRTLFRARTMQSALDLLYGMACALMVIGVALYLRVDPLRFYPLAGVLCGMALYRFSLGAALRAGVHGVKKWTKNEK